jgi:predicted nuclease of predicted toxin-antitoxin system
MSITRSFVRLEIVRFLIDAQLPPALARHLTALGHEAEHVGDVELLTAGDERIWEYATAVGAVLITKDEDFVTMRALSKHDGPPVIWVRLGNTTKQALIGRFTTAFSAIIEALKRGETVIQIPEV